MLSKKYFLAGGPTFSAPLACPTRAEARDHIDPQESDYRPSYMSYRGLQQQAQSKTNFLAIFRTAQFSTFSTASTQHGRGGQSSCNAQHVRYLTPFGCALCRLRWRRVEPPMKRFFSMTSAPPDCADRWRHVRTPRTTRSMRSLGTRQSRECCRQTPSQSDLGHRLRNR
jgi:hypothetical protein